MAFAGAYGSSLPQCLAEIPLCLLHCGGQAVAEREERGDGRGEGAASAVGVLGVAEWAGEHIGPVNALQIKPVGHLVAREMPSFHKHCFSPGGKNFSRGRFDVGGASDGHGGKRRN